MRIVVVTAMLPYGTDEAFILPEISEFLRLGHRVLVVPRSPRGQLIHGESILDHSSVERLLSARVLKTAAVVAMGHRPRTAGAARILFRGRSAATAMKNAAVFPKALWLAETASRWGAAHIYCHWGGTTATMAMIASAISGIPWSVTFHRWDIVEDNLLCEKVESAALARFISESGLKLAMERGVKPGRNVRVLYMGVPMAKQERAAARVHPAAGKPVVLCPARLVEVKGHSFLLEAWRILQSRGIAAELWLAGDGELRQLLERQARALAIADSVKFMGTVPHSTLLGYYGAGSISAVVLSSVDLGRGNHEGIPVALIEAMSYGVPVVATRTGGVAELVQPGTGLLVPHRDPGALADSIALLLVNSGLAARIGENGRMRVRSEFEISRVAAELLAAFEKASRSGKQLAPERAGPAPLNAAARDEAPAPAARERSPQYSRFRPYRSP